MPLLKPFILQSILENGYMKLHSHTSLTKSSNQTHTNILRINNLENLIFDQLN